VCSLCKRLTSAKTALRKPESVGCVGLRRLSKDICEMERLFARPRYQGLDLGNALATKVTEDACEIGYRRMRLDTVSAMRTAIASYTSLGFREIEPYRHNSIEGAKFVELGLTL
jgi:ribosomal protein S18 acetylase RimI-like enzyme